MKENKNDLRTRIDKVNERFREIEEQPEKEEPINTDNEPSIEEELKIEEPKRSNKRLKIFGAIALAAGILAMTFTGSPTVDTSESAQNALTNQVSTAVSAGVVLLSADEDIGAQDHTIIHQSAAEETKIWIWDYAAEDGDYVQVIVNGTPVTDPFMIKHKPKELMVPTTGEIHIKGIKDGGGGITYAVRYDVNGTSYFNSAPEGEHNTYELRAE